MQIQAARSAALAMMLAVSVVACSTEGPAETGINELPENLGTELTDDAYVLSEITWSADGTEIYYQTNETPGQLAAVSLSGQTRILDGPRDTYFDISASSDGTSLYFAADLQSGLRSVYRLPLNGGSAETLTSRGTAVIAAAPADGRLALPSPDGKRAAFTSRPDSVLMYTVATGAREHVGNGCERVVDWSPDQSTLLCQTGSAGAGVFKTIDVATGANEIVDIVPVQQGTMLIVDWQASGIIAGYINFGGLFIWDPQTRSGSPLLAVTGVPGTTIDPRNGAWTQDGSRIVFWVHQCLVQRGGGTCVKGQSLLYVGDLATMKTELLAVAKGDQGATFLALSPDGTKVAYLFNDRIYWQPTVIP